ncbi:hypothetical protein EYF80_021105 [Liparis tanakae]|uniref:Uncharacterized protein n=1 Tax=Liparis tanakae TaxID=230148 RepID=A0A4Z2HS78_9TELE|nr:hypothetical protein EYF80_021105 [Liparis tanakae]
MLINRRRRRRKRKRLMTQRGGTESNAAALPSSSFMDLRGALVWEAAADSRWAPASTDFGRIQSSSGGLEGDMRVISLTKTSKWHLERSHSAPSDRTNTCSDFREGPAERFSSAGLRSMRRCGAFLGAGDSRGAVLTEDRLSASSAPPSVRPASSLELDSGLLTHTPLRGPMESCDGVRRRSSSDLSLTGAEQADLEEPFCSEECEDKDSMLPVGVLLGLLLKAQGRGVEAAGLPGPRGQADGPAPARALGLRQGHVGVRRLVEDLEVQRGALIVKHCWYSHCVGASL